MENFRVNKTINRLKDISAADAGHDSAGGGLPHVGWQLCVAASSPVQSRAFSLLLHRSVEPFHVNTPARLLGNKTRQIRGKSQRIIPVHKVIVQSKGGTILKPRWCNNIAEAVQCAKNRTI
jgi:hypothetical protein